jgi:protein ImuA
MESLPDLLSRHAHQIWRGRNARPTGAFISTGYQELDSIIGAGWPAGGLVEVMAVGPGLGRASLLLPALATVTQAGKSVAWMAANDPPYPPALLQAGVALDRMVIVDADDHRQRLWCAEQSLREPACAAVVMAETRPLSDTLLRRLKLAAASTGCICFLLRDERVADSPSPASVRIRVRGTPDSPHRYVTVLKCSGHPPRTITLDLDARG